MLYIWITVSERELHSGYKLFCWKQRDWLLLIITLTSILPPRAGYCGASVRTSVLLEEMTNTHTERFLHACDMLFKKIKTPVIHPRNEIDWGKKCAFDVCCFYIQVS